MTNGSEPALDPKAAGKARIFVGVFVLVSAAPPLINAMGNPSEASERPRTQRTMQTLPM
jgi:hypothetical protein